MTRPSRRTLLGSTATLIGLSAGCIADDTGSPAGDDDDRNDADEGSPLADGEPESTEALPDGLANYGTMAYQYSTDSAASQHETESSAYRVEPVRDGDRTKTWLESRSLFDSESVTEFVGETDFETSILVAFEADVSTPCHEIVLDSIDIEDAEDERTSDGSGDGTDGADDELVLEASVRETSSEDGLCAQSIASIGLLVRVTFDSEPLTALSATITGPDGSAGISMASDSASASRSTSGESESGSGSDTQSDDGS